MNQNMWIPYMMVNVHNMGSNNYTLLYNIKNLRTDDAHLTTQC